MSALGCRLRLSLYASLSPPRRRRGETVGSRPSPPPLSRLLLGASVFDFPLSTRPGGSGVVGGRGKQKTKNRGGPGPRMSKYLVQEGVTDVTDATDPKPRDVRVTEAILTSVGTAQLNPPGGTMGAEAIQDLNFQENPHLGPPALKTFACGASNGRNGRNGRLFLFFAQGARPLRGGGRGGT